MKKRKAKLKTYTKKATLVLTHSLTHSLPPSLETPYLPIPLHHVNDLVHRRVTPQMDIGIVNFIFPANRNHGLGVQRSLRHEGLVANPSSILLPEHDARRFLVQPNPEPVQLALDQNFVGGGLGDVENDEDDVAGTSGGDDLTTTASEGRGKGGKLVYSSIVLGGKREEGKEEGREGEYMTYLYRP